MVKLILALSPFIFIALIVLFIMLKEHYRTQKAIKNLAIGLAALLTPMIACALRKFAQRITYNGTEKGSNSTLI